MRAEMNSPIRDAIFRSIRILVRRDFLVQLGCPVALTIEYSESLFVNHGFFVAI
jgi:hypothetical protein